MSIFTSGRFPSSLPEALRPKAGGLLPAQRRVYEDFSRIPRVTAALAQSSSTSGTGGPFQLPGSGAGSQTLAGFQLPGSQGSASDPMSFGRSGLGGTTSPLRTGIDSSLPLGSQMPSGLGAQQMPSSFAGAASLLGSGQQPSVGAAPGVGEGLTTAQALEKLSLIVAKLDAHLGQLVPSGYSTLASLPAEHEVHTLVRQAGGVAAMTLTRDESALQLVQRIFKRMYEQAGGGARLYTQVNVQLILAIHQVSKKVSRFVTDLLLYSDDERKLHGEIVGALLSAGLLSMKELSSHLASHIDGGRNAPATQFAMRLVRTALIDDHACTAAECSELLHALSKLAASAAPPDGLQRLLEDASRAISGGQSPAAGGAAGGAKSLTELRVALAARALPAEEDDPQLALAREQVHPHWEEWLGIFEQQNHSDKAYATFLANLQTAGWLRADAQGERFLRCLFDAAIAAACPPASPDNESGKPAVTFAPLDALSTLIVLMIKFVPGDPAATSAPSGRPADSAKSTAQIALLTKALGALMGHLLRTYDNRPHDFNQRAYLRLFGSFLFELNAPDPTLDPIQPQVLSAFAAAFLALQPSRLPGFAFAWLELISHRMFMPKLLLGKGQRGWPHLQRLLVALFSFLQPYLSVAELSTPTRTLYRGALRVLLVLLHDFPEFLCDHHFALCDVIPPSCIQMRNLVLSAFPRNMRLPDPFTPNLKVDLLPEISQPPRILAPVTAPLAAANLLTDIDSFLASRQPLSLLLDLRNRLVQPDGTPRAPLINALVLHVGTVGIASLHSSQAQPQALAHSAPMDILQRLAADMAAEARYVLLNAIANQLRYPNNHTHYFSCVLLYLFAETTDERVQETITRVLVERLIVHRPHPWGLLITFIELIKNPRYNFWSKTFTRCAPEIERLFESVARSCMAPGAGGAPGALAQAVGGEEG